MYCRLQAFTVAAFIALCACVYYWNIRKYIRDSYWYFVDPEHPSFWKPDLFTGHFTVNLKKHLYKTCEKVCEMF